jgi:hypothetical protein
VNTVSIALELETLTCGDGGCGIVFAVPQVWVNARRRDHNSWYCPNGHQRYFPNKSEEEKLREALASANGNLSYYKEGYQRRGRENEQLERSLRAQKAVNTRMKRRVTNGVCTACHRSFANVQRHMEKQHPDQVVSADAALATGQD